MSAATDLLSLVRSLPTRKVLRDAQVCILFRGGHGEAYLQWCVRTGRSAVFRDAVRRLFAGSPDDAAAMAGLRRAHAREEKMVSLETKLSMSTEEVVAHLNEGDADKFLAWSKRVNGEPSAAFLQELDKLRQVDIVRCRERRMRAYGHQ
jgi:hypothetical protein